MVSLTGGNPVNCSGVLTALVIYEQLIQAICCVPYFVHAFGLVSVVY
jgi:hypothetical protein